MASTYEVIFNPEPSKVILTTNSLDEACSAIIHSPQRPCWDDIPETERWHAWERPSNPRLAFPPLLVPGICTLATEWRIRTVPGELTPAFVILKDGHPIMLSDEEIKSRAWAWDKEHMDDRWMRRINGTKPSAVRWYQKGNAHHRTMRLDDQYDRENPPIRPGARVPDAWDAREGPVKASKSWKDQSKRRHQWKPMGLCDETGDQTDEPGDKAKE